MKRNHKIRFLYRVAIVACCVSLLVGHTRICGSAARVYHSNPTGGDKRIALTFDDGPHPSQTGRILDILDSYGVKATFFMIGVNVENYPDAAKEVLKRGHEIGNHTYSHSHLNRLGEVRLSEELEKCEDILENLCEYRSRLFRPPEGYISDGVLECAEQGDYSLILWSVDTRDWEVKNTTHIVETVMSKIKGGDIILMHDYVYQSKTPEALEILLPKLLALGYQPVTVGELLGIR